MIKSAISIKGSVNSAINVKGKTNTAVIVEQPELENLEVNPSMEEQVFTPESYGFNEVKVNKIQTENIEISPSLENQKYDGIYKEITVNAIEENVLNIVPSEENQTFNGVFTQVNVDPESGGIDTSDATATAEDILVGKTAYANNEKIEGIYKPLDTSDADATAKDICMNKTAYVNGEKITGTLWEAGITTMTSKDIVDNGYGIDIKRTMDQDYLFRKGGSITFNTKYTDMANAIGLTPDKIADGNTIIGVAGTHKSLDTSDADATAKDIAMNKTAYVNGEKITGALLEPSMCSISTDNIIDAGSRVDIEGKMPTDYLFRKNSSITYNIKYPSLANAIGLTSEKIMKGNTVIGVSGNATSDADATAADIMKDKTAYVNGVKVVGTYEEAGGESENNVKLVPDSTLSATFAARSFITDIGELDLQGMTSMNEAFSQFTRLKKIGKLKNTNQVTNWKGAFGYCKELTDLPDELDTSSATSMYETFRNCTLLKKIPKMDTSKVTDFYQTFYLCENLEEIPADFNVSGATQLRHTFNSCKSITKFPLLNTSKITSMEYMLSGCSNLTEVAKIDTSNLTTATYMFSGCSNLKNLPNLDLSKVTNANGMLCDCGFVELPKDLGDLQISHIKSMYSIFSSCKKLISINNLDLSGVNDCNGAFANCTALTTVSGIDLSNATSIYGMFNGCSALKEVSGIVAPKATSWTGMFRNCSMLETIGEIDMSAVNNTGQYFLTSMRLKNLGGFINYGKGFTQKSANNSNCTLYLNSSSYLTYESLMNVINGLYDLNLTYDVTNGGTLYTQKVQIGSTNKAKLTAEEIAIATAKGWTVS